MKFVVTMMVRDEIDVIAAMIEHTLAQGPDLVIVTDNASVDGTREVLQRYADRGLVELHDDPEHRKQQGAVVTGMAQRAFTEHGADWVINADADEFWKPVDPTLTLRQALERIPKSLGAFTADVVNVIAPPARRGSGLVHATWRDHRTPEQLQAVGIHAQPTPNAVHRGDPDVKVSQGNHFVSIESAGQPDPAVALEVVHVPWRSWAQLRQKVSHAGRGYEASPHLKPSRNHHGMADYRRLLGDRLEQAYLLRSPSRADLEAGEADGTFVRDDWLPQHLRALLDTAVFPDLLAPLLDDTDDAPFTDEEIAAGVTLGRQFLALEQERMEEGRRADASEKRAREMYQKLKASNAALKEARSTVTQLQKRPAGPPPSVARRAYRKARRVAGRVRRRVTARS